MLCQSVGWLWCCWVLLWWGDPRNSWRGAIWDYFHQRLICFYFLKLYKNGHPIFKKSKVMSLNILFVGPKPKDLQFNMIDNKNEEIFIFLPFLFSNCTNVTQMDTKHGIWHFKNTFISSLLWSSHATGMQFLNELEPTLPPSYRSFFRHIYCSPIPIYLQIC